MKQEKSLAVERSQLLNAELAVGAEVTDHLDIFQAIERPIVLDLNGCIANNEYPMMARPGSQAFLSELRQLGTVVIATLAPNWSKVHAFLKHNRLWHDDMLLLVPRNFKTLMSPLLNIEDEAVQSRVARLREEYAWSHPMLLDGEPRSLEALFSGPLELKRLAPLFQKSWRIPIIDDSRSATENNPGMFGVRIISWPGSVITTKDAVCLPEAATIIRNHMEAQFTGVVEPGGLPSSEADLR